MYNEKNKLLMTNKTITQVEEGENDQTNRVKNMPKFETLGWKFESENEISKIYSLERGGKKFILIAEKKENELRVQITSEPYDPMYFFSTSIDSKSEESFRKILDQIESHMRSLDMIDRTPEELAGIKKIKREAKNAAFNTTDLIERKAY